MGRRRAPSAAARSAALSGALSGASGAGERSSGASPRWLSAMARQRASPKRLAPASPEPVGGVEAGGIEARDPVALPGAPAQHRVDEPAIGRETGPRGQRHGARHRRMGRRLEEGELADPEPQQVLDRPPARRQRTVHEAGEEGVDLAEAAERREQQQAREGGVAGREPVQPRRGGQRLLQRPSPAQDRAQRMGRDRPRVRLRATGRRQSRRGADAWRPAAGSAGALRPHRAPA